MLRSPCKGRNLIIETLTFQIYCSNNFSFLLKWSTIKNQHGKIRIYFLEECNKLHKYQTRFSVKTFIFIISTWGVYHAIYYVLQLPKYFNPNWHKCSFWAPGPKVKTFFEILWFYWIHPMILEKMRPCLFVKIGARHKTFRRKWPVLAANFHTRQKIIHNSVKTYDILMK